MPGKFSPNSMFLINVTTGISDGLMLPFAVCIIAGPLLSESPVHLAGTGILIAFFGAIVYGLARFFGEREEILHNHPQLAAGDTEQEIALMNAIGIDGELTLEMQSQMEKERVQWLNEVEENNMGWQSYDRRRAAWSGLHTSLGFLVGGLLVCVPFLLIRINMVYFLLPGFFYLFLLFCFGWIKAKFLDIQPLKYALIQCSKGFLILTLSLAIAIFIALNHSGPIFPDIAGFDY